MGLYCSFKETRTLIEITFSVMSFETFRLQNRGNRIITFSMLPSMDLRKKKRYSKDIHELITTVITLLPENGWEGLGGYTDKTYFIYCFIRV